MAKYEFVVQYMDFGPYEKMKALSPYVRDFNILNKVVDE